MPTEAVIQSGSVDSFDTPAQLGYQAMNYDPNVPVNAGLLTTLQPRVEKLLVPGQITVTNLHFYVQTIGATLTVGSNQCGIYNSSGVRIATTDPAATLTAFSGTTGLKTLALTADGGQSLVIPGGPGQFIWWVALSSGTTPVTMPRNSGIGGFLNGILGAGVLRCGTLANVISGNGLPTSFTPSGGITAGNVTLWAALS